MTHPLTIGTGVMAAAAMLCWLAYAPALTSEAAVSDIPESLDAVRETTADEVPAAGVASAEALAARATPAAGSTPNPALTTGTDIERADRLVMLEQRIVQLGHRLKRLESQLIDQDRILRDVALLASGHGNREPGSLRRVDEFATGEIERSQQFRLALLESVFDAETIDASWSDTVSNEIRESLGLRAGPRLEILDVGCRSTLCRIEAAHVEPYRHADWQVALLSSPDAGFADVWSAEESSSDDSRFSTIYVVRRGHTLPKE